MLMPADSPQTGTDHAPAPATELRSRAHVPWRPLIAAALVAVALGVALTGVLAKRHAGVAPAVSHTGLSSLPLAAQGQISTALGADQQAYRVSRTAEGFAAFNPAQLLHARFGRSGVVVSSGTSTFGVSMRAIGYGSSLTRVGEVVPTAKANRVSYVHPGVTEWYANGPLGLEQGFTIPRALAARQAGPLTLSLALSGNAHPTRARDTRSLALGDSLRYRGLRVTDQDGRTVHSWLGLQNGRLLIRVDAGRARYPLRIDPFIQQGAKLTGAGAIGPAHFGSGVALSSDGSTALIGGTSDAEDHGAAWVFTRSGETWSQQAKLTGGGEVGKGQFGMGVALSSDGNTALVGGPALNGNGAGAAWVFTRSGSAWTQQAMLTGGGEIGEGGFGYSVGLSSDGSTALVGGFNDNSGAGAVWAFNRSGSTWTQQDKFTSGNGFGVHLALSGDGNTALIGSLNAGGKSWVYVRSGSTWVQQAKLTDEEGYGWAVALSADGNVALDTDFYNDKGLGAALVFTRSGSTWTQGPKLTGGGEEGSGQFGESATLSASGSTALIGGTTDGSTETEFRPIGAAWVFARSGSNWIQQGAKLRGGEESGYGRFGSAVALSASGNTALIGGITDACCLGAAWVFVNPNPTVVTSAASSVTQTSATLNATVNPNGSTVSDCHFEYGTSTSYGFSVPCSALPGSGENEVAVSASIGALSEDTTYHFRIVATNANGTSYGSDVMFTTLPPPPTVSDVDPNSGTETGGTSVTITGTSLGSASAVHFGSTRAASFTVDSDTSITAVSPPGTGTVDVTVTTRGGTSATTLADQFAYLAIPTVVGVSPGRGPEAGGTSVSITGTNLDGASAVKFGSSDAASFTVESDSSITAVSPAGTETVDVTVTTGEGTSSTNSADRFTYVPAPTVTALSPDSGPEGGGTSVTITGTNLTGATAVTFGATAVGSFKVNSATSITAVGPAGTGTVDVTVTTLGGTSAPGPADQFRYLAAPEYGRCLTVAKGTGLFENANCTKAGGTKTHEWYPAAGGTKPLVKPRFTTAIKELTVAKLYIAGKHIITCTGETGSGEYSGPKTIANVAITLTGCSLDALDNCQSLEAGPGEVVLSTLEGELGVIATSTEGPLKNKIGTDLKPASEPVVAAFACASTPVLITGSIIGEVPRNAMKLTTTPKFVTSTRGLQKPTRFEGGEEDVLLTKLGEDGAFEQTGVKLTMIQTNEEKVEVNSVV